jgi:hypothetical protein
MNTSVRFGAVRISGWCLLAVVAMAAPAGAQVTNRFILKTADYFQTSDNVPGALSQVQVNAGINTAGAGDVTSANFTKFGASSPTSFVQQGPASWGLPVYDTFFTLAAADAAYPNGGYLFETAGGTVGSTSVTVQLQGAFPAEPVFTGTSLHDLATMDPGGPITVTFNGFTPDPTLNGARLSIMLVGGPSVFQFFDPSVTATSYTFPAGTFAPDTNYSINLEYFNDNLDGAAGQSDYSAFTQASIRTASVPEPAALGLIGLGAGAVAARRRRRHA